MHYPVTTERQVALRWRISLKTLRRWRLDNQGPIWHKLFHHVRYHEADIIEFERQPDKNGEQRGAGGPKARKRGGCRSRDKSAKARQNWRSGRA